MKFGLALPYNRTLQVPEWAKMAEDQGWDGIFLGDAIWTEDPIIALTAAALATSRIRLGTMLIPVPLRRPWKIASESIALDHLSNGRLILGLGTGAAWMGWYAFPDEITDPQARADMLHETVEILTRMYQSKPFDFEGNHYHLKLTLLNEMYYPPQPRQKPRIPLWIPAVWPHHKSLQRTLKSDGVIVEKRSSGGKDAEVTPEDIAGLKAYLEANRPSANPFDIIINGNSYNLQNSQQQERIRQFKQAGATWWIEGLWDASPEAVTAVIKAGPPALK
ncbi:MAG: LLM class flavin-dependent oxidoreductase [Anaerolineales bacterium]|nr:LLM class flavin-dependent oxidoreductase [Anaerolineales bacterium]